MNMGGDEGSDGELLGGKVDLLTYCREGLRVQIRDVVQVLERMRCSESARPTNMWSH